jgi:hypothetical protein
MKKQDKLTKLKNQLKECKPRKVNEFTWQRRNERIQQEIYMLENNIPIPKTEVSSNVYGKTFWKASEKTDMRHSMGTSWGVNKSGIANWVTNTPDNKR